MNFLRKISLLAAFTIVGLQIASPVNAQQIPLNIAVVDIEKVLILADAPKSIREQVKKIRESYREQIVTEENALRQANQELAQKQTLLSAEAFKEERRKFEKKVLEVQKSVQQNNIKLQKAQNEAQDKVKLALRKAVLTVSQAKNFTLVLRRAQTVVVADQFDISKEVIAALNKELPKVTVALK